MADDPTKRGPADRSRISLLEPYEVQYWADKFGVSKERLSEAVRRIGHSADAPGTGRTQKPAEGAQGRTELGLRADEMLKEVAPCLTHVKNDGSERCGKSEQSLARSTYDSCMKSCCYLHGRVLHGDRVRGRDLACKPAPRSDSPDKFGVSKERLSEAVRRVGHSADQ
jgi:Protein of unknown function (DUF3606)